MIFSVLPKAASRIRVATSFTLVELLTVMAIIAILAALILGAGNGVLIKGMRSRAAAEIQAMSTAAEGYKTDNGIYPQGDGALTTNSPYTVDDGTSLGGEYQINSALLFEGLSGQTNFTTAPTAGIKAYMSFKPNQVTTPASGNTYIHDPWNASYGYSTGTATSGTYTAAPYNGGGFFDLWSAAGVTKTKVSANPVLTNTWISNWTQ